MPQKNSLYKALETWYTNTFVQLKLSNIKTDNNLTGIDTPEKDVPVSALNDGHVALYGWESIIQQTKEALQSIIEDTVQPNMQMIYYPTNGYMNWHTNSNNPSTRIYLVRATENPKSEMKFIDNVIEDKPLWSFNIFNIGKKTWHCIDAKTERLSLGFHYKGNQSVHDLKEKLNMAQN